MNAPQVVKAKLVKSSFLNKKILHLSFSTQQKFEFLAGQYVSIKVGESDYRAYSICSNPKENDGFEIVASVQHKGKGSAYLKNLKPNDLVQVVGPRGKFILGKQDKKIVLLATGTGIAPYISFLHELEAKRYKGEIVLLFGNRYHREIFFEDKLQDFLQQLDLKLHIYLSQEEKEGYIKGRITRNLDKFIDKKAQYFLCGNPLMVEEASEIFLKHKISKENIFTEKYTWSVQ